MQARSPTFRLLPFLRSIFFVPSILQPSHPFFLRFHPSPPSLSLFFLHFVIFSEFRYPSPQRRRASPRWSLPAVEAHLNLNAFQFYRGTETRKFRSCRNDIFYLCRRPTATRSWTPFSSTRRQLLEGFSKHHSYFSFYPERFSRTTWTDRFSVKLRRLQKPSLSARNAITVSRILILMKSCGCSEIDKLKHLQSLLKILFQGAKDKTLKIYIFCSLVKNLIWDIRTLYLRRVRLLFVARLVKYGLHLHKRAYVEYRDIDASNSRRGIGKSTKRYAPSVASNSFETVIAILIDSPVNRRRLYYSTRELESVSNCLQVAVSGIEIDSLRRP